MLGRVTPPLGRKAAKVFQMQGLCPDLLVDGRSKSCQHWVVHCKVLKKLGLPRVGGAISDSVPPIVANRGAGFVKRGKIGFYGLVALCWRGTDLDLHIEGAKPMGAEVADSEAQPIAPWWELQLLGEGDAVGEGGLILRGIEVEIK